MPIVVGQTVLGVYAVLLAVGGLIGYGKAGSLPSLVAGVGSAAGVLIALALSVTTPAPAFIVAALIAMFLQAFFLMRYLKTRRFMPSAMLAGLSMVVAGVCVIQVATLMGK